MGLNEFAAVVVAAGVSSRMQQYKPLLQLSEKTMIEHVVTTLNSVGIRQIVVVLGPHLQAVSRLLEPYGVEIIENKKYLYSTMFDSACLGINAVKSNFDGFFFLPGDMPLLRPHTFELLQHGFDKGENKIVQPTYKGKRGHPVLVDCNCIPTIVKDDGKLGLKGALQKIKGSRLEIPVADEGVLLDADTPEDYRRIEKAYKNRNWPSKEVCREIQAVLGTPQKVVEHCIAVEMVAQRITDQLAVAGIPLNRNLVCAGAMLHDVAKQERQKNHAAIGASWLVEMGYAEIAWIVASHMDLSLDAIEKLDERSVVYLADKLVCGTREVPLEQRKIMALQRFGQDKQARDSIYTRLGNAAIIEQKVANICSSSLPKAL